MKNLFFILSLPLIFFVISCGNNSSPSAVPMQPSQACDFIGNTSDAATSNWTTGYYVATSYTVSASMKIKTLAAYFRPGYAEGHCAMAIYSNSATNVPGYLLTKTNIIENKEGWVKTAVPEITLNAGSTYWIVFMGELRGPTYYSTGYSSLNSTVSWSSFLTTGFPLDLSTKTWTIYNSAKQLHYASSCSY